MKWRAPSERMQFWLAAPIAVPVAVLCAIWLLPVAAMLWLDRKCRARQAARGWHPWLAWRPVKIGQWWAKDRRWVWLETVERRVRDYGDGYDYRLPGAEARSDERRVGKGGGRTCRSRWSPVH